MKKILTIVALFVVAASCSAQKSNVNRAMSMANAVDNPDYAGAVALIEAALQDESTKDNAKTWYTAAYVYDRWQQNERVQGDAVKAGEYAMKACNYYKQAYVKDQQPNAKGKIAPKYAQKIPDALKAMYRSYVLYNAGAKASENRDYVAASKYFTAHYSLLNESIVANSENCPPRDSTYFQVRYFDAISTQLAGDIDGVIPKYEALKDSGYKETTLYQYLYNIYVQRHDTANFVRILEQGHQRFPNEFFYLGSLINYYLENNQRQKASDFLEKAIQGDPSNAQYYSVKGNLLNAAKQYDEAMKYYNKAIELAPNSADAWRSKADAVFEQAFNFDQQAGSMRNEQLYQAAHQKSQETYREALTLYEKAAALNPNDLATLRRLKALYFRFNDMDKYNAVNEKIKSL